MQIVLVGNRVVAHGDDCFLSMGGTVVCNETGKAYPNATITAVDAIPVDIDTVGYEYRAGVFVPCAPYGVGAGNLMVACEECGTPKRSNVTADADGGLHIPGKLTGGAIPDETAAALGLASGATFNTALNALRNLANSKAVVASGSYVGTGTYGEDNPTTIELDFTPNLVIVSTANSTPTAMHEDTLYDDWESYWSSSFRVFVAGASPLQAYDYSYADIVYTMDENRFTQYADYPSYSPNSEYSGTYERHWPAVQMNEEGKTYYYLALGGYEAGSGDSGSGGSTGGTVVSDAVMYTEQMLTDGQQAQARANIGAASNGEVEQLSAKVTNLWAKAGRVSALPAPSEALRGTFAIVPNDGTDALYVCMSVNGVIGWVAFNVGGGSSDASSDTTSVLGVATLGNMVLGEG